MKKHDAVLWVFFIVLLAFRILFDMSYWLILGIETCVLAIVLLKKAGAPSKRHIYISVVLSILSTVAYLGYQSNPWILLYGLRAGIPTLLCSLAVFSVTQKRKGFRFLFRTGKHPVAVSVMIAVVVGAVLSVINLIGNDLNFELTWQKLLLCLNPAIFEEIADRAIFFAFCIWSADSHKMNIFQNFTMYFMSFVPHCVVHGFPLWQTVLLCIMFGLPFAILQKKRDWVL